MEKDTEAASEQVDLQHGHALPQVAEAHKEDVFEQHAWEAPTFLGEAGRKRQVSWMERPLRCLTREPMSVKHQPLLRASAHVHPL